MSNAFLVEMIAAIGFLLQKFRQCKAVEASIKSGKKLNDLVKMDGKKVVSTSVKLPDNVKNWVGDFLPAQVKDVYGELTEKKPAGVLNAVN